MATYHSSVFVGPNETAKIRHYMDDEPKREEDAFTDGAILNYATYFNGYEIEIRCLGPGYFEDGGVNTAWGEAWLYDKQGNPVDYITFEDSSDYFSDLALNDGKGNEYVAHVIANKED